MVADRFVYLTFALYLLVAWCLVWRFSARRRRLVLISVVGLVAGPLAEVFYFYDYWRPPTAFGNGVVSLADMVAGFALAGVPAGLHYIWFPQKTAASAQPQMGLFLGLLAIGVVALSIVTFATPVNSMLASPLLFLLATAVILSLRPDLVKPALVGGFVLLVLVLPIYCLLFNFVSPHFWQDYGLFGGTLIDVSVWGIPLTELLWYATWGAVATIAHPFARGNVLTNST